ncbi:MAG: hypothetical protein ACEPO2_21985 [Pelagibaca sp.]
MTRILLLILGAGCLGACEPYREPDAHCFDVVSRGPASHECHFEPLMPITGHD